MAVQQMFSEGSSFVFYSDLFIDLHTGGKEIEKLRNEKCQLLEMTVTFSIMLLA